MSRAGVLAISGRVCVPPPAGWIRDAFGPRAESGFTREEFSRLSRLRFYFEVLVFDVSKSNASEEWRRAFAPWATRLMEFFLDVKRRSRAPHPLDAATSARLREFEAEQREWRRSFQEKRFVISGPPEGIHLAAPLVDCEKRGREFFGDQAAAGDFHLWTPETIRTKLDQVNAAIAQFTGDVSRSTAPEVWRAPFATFLQTWATFYTGARSSWWSPLSQLWGETYIQAAHFETRLAEWQTDFVTKNYGPLSGPRLQPEEERERERERENALPTSLKVLGVGLAIAGVAYVVAKVVP